MKLGELTVNRIGFGAMRVIDNGSIWGEPSDRAKALKVLRRALELDVNFFDTAESYGPHTSETLIAEALHPYPKGFVIGTKCGIARPRASRWDADGRPEKLRKDLEGSLKRLRLERIDLYQLHTVDPKVPLEVSLGERAERDPPRRRLERDREAAGAGAENRADRLGAEPLQPGRSQFGRRAAGLREARHRLPAVVPARRRGSTAHSEIKGLGKEASGHPGADRHRVAARQVAGHAADSRHLVDRPPRRKRRRREARAERGRPQPTVSASRAEPLAPASSTQENSSSPLSSATVWNCRNGLAAMPGDISARNTSTPL